MTNLPEKFANYFVDKIVTIQDTIATQQTSISNLEQLRSEISPFSSSTSLTQFEPTTESEVRSVITSMSNATSELDPIPTDILKGCLNEIAPHLTKIINLSLNAAEFPTELKIAIVKPLIKKKLLDPDKYKNYRPVSNLSFLSKLIEKIVCRRIETHLEINSLLPPMQSAYRKNHSTETALLKIQNDLLLNMDKGKMSALILLDLSSAFDTINHNILLSRLRTRFHIDGLALKWIESYLKGRTQVIQIKGVGKSSERTLNWGVPQGSILGPLLFSLYTAPLGDIANKYSMDHHFYADDAQIYHALENAKCESDLQQCVNDYRNWMLANDLKVNDDKTEILLIGSPYFMRKKPSITFSVGDIAVSSVEKVTNLGVVFDSNLTMNSFIGKKCATCLFYLKSIGKVRKFLTVDATKCLIQAFVISRLDYCNSLLSGVTKQNLHKLQLIQNAAARLVYRQRKFDRITPTLYELHWLPVSQRINFKVLVHVFNSVSGSGPKYLDSLLSYNKQSRNLRSSNSMVLYQHKVRTNFGSRAFANYGPAVWNNLPTEIRLAPSVAIFKRKLKTYLFQQAYGCD